MLPFYQIAAGAVFGLLVLYSAYRSREFRKFLAGVFFMTTLTLIYFYVANISLPILGANISLSPQISGLRSIVHFILFLLCFYFGFVKAPPATSPKGSK